VATQSILEAPRSGRPSNPWRNSTSASSSLLAATHLVLSVEIAIICHNQNAIHLNAFQCRANHLRYGAPVSVGNTVLELGVHLASSPPECRCLEFSNLVSNEFAVAPVRFNKLLCNAPGRGIEFDQDELERLPGP
jgi:hypothetical protein